MTYILAFASAIMGKHGVISKKNRKYITYRKAARAGSSYGTRQA